MLPSFSPVLVQAPSPFSYLSGPSLGRMTQGGARKRQRTGGDPETGPGTTQGAFCLNRVVCRIVWVQPAIQTLVLHLFLMQKRQ